MAAPKEILDLVDKFSRNREEYMSPSFNEATLRQEFLNPFFKVLGWDVDNTQGHAMAYREVIHEDQVKVGDATKAPDYAFRVGGQRKFFVEAKKPAINIEKDPGPAYQLRRYAWSAGLLLSILTDFEQFAVYDTRIKPDPKDKAGLARVMLVNCADFAQKWDEIAAIFAKTAVYQGAFDKYADAHKKRGQLTVDADFLGQIEDWREQLAKNLKLRNPKLSIDDLNFAVGKIIDRIIFLRVCEGRGIETTHSLQALLNGGNAYPRLLEIFRWADDKYNSGLFHFNKEKGRPESPDELTTRVEVDDKVIQSIVKGLYLDSPYEFSVLPVEILGQIYEQFLGKVIVATEARAHVEEKPEVRKAGGVYYTPRYIVDYIVENTVGKLLEGKTPKSAADLKILDPACGSGSFLLGAYQYLLNWHRKWYAEHDPEKLASGKSPVIFKGPGGDWRLTAGEKKRILLNNIHGVDIDRQAVEVTKLSLLLQVLEGETAETLGNQKKLFQERALPDLGGNIKCGNSLIGNDFFEGHLIPDAEQLRIINPFNWKQQFPEVMKAGGFNAVIGNPPYGMVDDEIIDAYFNRAYSAKEGRNDNYEHFIERSSTVICKEGFVGFIIPNTMLSNLYTKKLRQYLSNNFQIEMITNFSMPVFSMPTVHTCIVIFRNPSKLDLKHQVSVMSNVASKEELLNSKSAFRVGQTSLGSNANANWDIFVDNTSRSLIEKLEGKSKPIGELCFIRQCIKTGNDPVYVKESATRLNEPWKPTLRGKSINRYATLNKNEYLKYGAWLARNWQNKTFYERNKIAVRETGNRIIATIDSDNRYFLSSLYAIYWKSDDNNLSLQYLLGVLNSTVATWYLQKIAFSLTVGAFTKFRTNQLARFPIKALNLKNKDEKSEHDNIVATVEKMFDMQKRLTKTNNSGDQERIQRQIDATDRQIDALVYELYGLTDEEIKIVEGS